MGTPSYKSKQYLLVALKVLILVVAIIYLYQRVANIDEQTWKEFTKPFSNKNPYRYYPIPILLFLAFFNWFFEIIKWKLLVSHLKPISLIAATKQSLSALTTSLATPVRIGDYGAKAAYYTKQDRRQILLLNFFGSGSQMLVTTFFGIIGFILVIINYPLPISPKKIFILILVLLLGCILLYRFRNNKLIFKGLSIKSVLNYINTLSLRIKIGTLILSLIRYLIFSFLFYLLLVFFGATTSFIPKLIFIFSMYFFVSIIPSYFIFDLAIRGGVAVFLFSIYGIAEPIVLSAVLSMWLLNFALPAIIGSYYVITFRPQISE